MRKQLAIGVSVLALTALGGVSENNFISDNHSGVHSQYTHFVRTSLNQFEPLSGASLDVGLPYRTNYQTAGVYFITGKDGVSFGDGKENDFSDPSGENCKRLGYTVTSCDSGLFNSACPYNDSIYDRCCEATYKYTSSTCTNPKTLSSDTCGGKHRCYCDSSKYPHTSCNDPQIKGNACTDDTGTRYATCTCPSGVATPYGCETYYASPCNSVCQKAYADNCRNRTAVQTPYGCESYFSDCSSKCEKAYPDNCRNRTAVSAPYGCSEYWSDCKSKCKTAMASCEGEIKSKYPNAVLVTNFAELSSNAMSGKDVIVMNNISNTSGTLYIGNGTKIFSADKAGSDLCSKTTITANVVSLNGASEINADVKASTNLTFNDASVTGNGALSASTIGLASNSNSFSGGSLTADTLTMPTKCSFTISNSSLNINKSLSFEAASHLTINGGTHNIKTMNFSTNSSYTATEFKINKASISMTRDAGAYYFYPIGATDDGSSPIKITLSASTFDIGGGQINYDEGKNENKKMTFRLENGSKMTNIGGIVCWGGSGLGFVLAANSNSSIQMIGKTGTCNGTPTIFSASNTSQEASVILGSDASGIMIFACMWKVPNNTYGDDLCTRRATCTNAKIQ